MIALYGRTPERRCIEDILTVRNVITKNELRLVHAVLLIRSNKMQQYAGIYLLQDYSTYFGCPLHPSSRVHKTVTAASITGHSI